MFELYEKTLSYKGEIAHPNDDDFMKQIDKLTYKPQLQEDVDEVLTEIKKRCDVHLFPPDFIMINQNGKMNYYL